MQSHYTDFPEARTIKHNVGTVVFISIFKQKEDMIRGVTLSQSWFNFLANISFLNFLKKWLPWRANNTAKHNYTLIKSAYVANV